MKEAGLANLIFLERQFNDIKPLIPVANSLLSESIKEAKFAKSAFRRAEAYWERLDRKGGVDPLGVQISKEDKLLLQSVLLPVMAFLVEVKRVSEAAAMAQKLCKYDLLALLGQLSKQVLSDPGIAPIPVFAAVSAPPQSIRFKDGGQGNPSQAQEVGEGLCAQVSHFEAKEILKTVFLDLRHYAEPDRDHWKTLQTDQKSYYKKARAAKSRSHLARGLVLVQTMYAQRMLQIRQLVDRSAVLTGKLGKLRPPTS